MQYTLDWNEYELEARQAVAEGIVVVENNDNTLPVKHGSIISVFGRMQAHYYKSGTGSGGMVNVTHVTDILEGLRESGVVELNEDLFAVYNEWEKSNPIDRGLGWGNEPWSQPEMELDDETVKTAADNSDVALAIIGRTAGEDKDSTNTPGSYMLTDTEIDMLKKVRKYFKKMIVLLNVGGIIDMSFVDSIGPDAVLYGWQGGMTGGHGTADVITGKVCPSGRLTDTVAYNIEDYISNKNFGNKEKNYYCEDIFVGYRYFETFAKDKVRYPFGYGLSYTEFASECVACNIDYEKQLVSADIVVKNIGDVAGKQVIQMYVSAPMGKLGKPARVLIGFEKTKLLAKREEQLIHIEAPFYGFASYDDSGVTGHESAYLLEEGDYQIFVGENVRDASIAGTFKINETVFETLTQAIAPVEEFDRLTIDAELTEKYETAPVSKCSQVQKRDANIPAEITFTGDKGIKLVDVLKGKNSIEEFVAQLDDDDLSCIIRGEGMGSSLVTPGTASAFGGVSPKLKAYGVPAICCDDGPSGMRLDSGAKSFSLPIGTLLGCTFNKELNEKLFEYLGLEMISNKVECLLGPGMNIHRHVLNGRNFEYFSEDPFLTGTIATAQLKGLKKYGLSGTVKHFCANNQELSRRHADSVVSERALREIYLKGFEMAVKSGYCDSIMTTYGRLNGLFTSNLYDLNTTVLRNEWGYTGVVMTDWWAAIKEDENGVPVITDYASMVKAQNDLYMVCPNGAQNVVGDNTLEELEAGNLTRAELQRSAINVCRFAMNSQAMKRLIGEADIVTVIDKPVDEDDVDVTNVEYTLLEDEAIIVLDDKPSVKGTNYVLAFDTKNPGDFRVTLRGSSKLNEVAQMTCTLFTNGFPIKTMTFHGTNGELDAIIRDVWIMQRFAVMRLNVGADGLELKDIKFKYIGPHEGQDYI